MEQQLQKQRQIQEQCQAELLIKDQIMQELKSQEIQTIAMYEEQIDELRDKLDRKEYVIQYKEEIWSTFERELKKVVKRDTELYQKIQNTTQILLENLNNTKVSNVVKENKKLQNDHNNALSIINNIIDSCQSNLEDEFINRKQSSRKQVHFLDKKTKEIPQLSQSLSSKLDQLQKLVNQLNNKVAILEEENSFIREEYTNVSSINQKQKKELTSLQEKIRLYQESINSGLQSQCQSTKACTTSATSKNSSARKDQLVYGRNSVLSFKTTSLMTTHQDQNKVSEFSAKSPTRPSKKLINSYKNFDMRPNLAEHISNIKLNIQQKQDGQSSYVSKKINKVQPLDQSLSEDELKDKNISVIQNLRHNSPCSPFIDTDESYI